MKNSGKKGAHGETLDKAGDLGARQKNSKGVHIYFIPDQYMGVFPVTFFYFQLVGAQGIWAENLAANDSPITLRILQAFVRFLAR